MTTPVVYLITGANRPRGIGFSLTTHILSTHENAFVYACVRDPKEATALQELKTRLYPSRLAVIKYLSGDVENNSAVAKDIEERHGHVDTVVANAALLSSMNPVSEVTGKEMEEHFHVNVVGAIVLFQSMTKLLKKSTNPRFITMSTLGGSIGGPIIHHKLGSTAYSTSKAALNWITRKIHFDNEWLVAFPLSPGGVQTDMYDFSMANNKNAALKDILKSEPPTPAQAAMLILKVIDGSTRDKDGGEFLNVDGTKLPW